MNKDIKTIAITGSTGGLGQNIANDLASLGYNLILINRNLKKSQEQSKEILSKYPNINVDFATIDFENINSVKDGIDSLKDKDFEVLILNAGVYNVPQKKMETGYNNIFQVNFLSQYYLVRELAKLNKLKKVVVTGSIAQSLSKIDTNDIDFSNKKSKMKIYGNSKRFFIFSLFEFLKNTNISLAVAHPGISSTNLTCSFHKSINWFVKFATKILFPSPKKASKNITQAVFKEPKYLEWVGPRVFNVWGKPKVKKISKISQDEIKQIDSIANKLYQDLQK